MTPRLRVALRMATLSTILCTPAATTFAHSSTHPGPASGRASAVVKEQKPWGIAGDAKAVARTIEVRMTDDMRFSPARIEVRQGETVKFVIRNAGQVMHEFVIGTRKDLDEHAALMAKHPNMEHDEPYMAHVPPGRSGEIVWHFNRAGDFDFACLLPGHYPAGMVGTIKVALAAASVGASAAPKR